MTDKNFVNFHVLISHSPSCLNRDDANMQKTAVFGGVNRVRVSSQSLKRAMRKSDYYQNALGSSSDRTIRLGALCDKYVHALKGRFSSEQVKEAIEWISGKEGIEQDTSSSAIAAWTVEEVACYCAAIQKGRDDGMDDAKLKKQIAKEADGFRNAFENSIDIALSGRMATSGLMTTIDGSLAVAHAITTHAVEPQDIDWFTAVDDLKPEDETGSAHLNTQQFSSGVFYRYASLNIAQLQKNLGGASRERALEVAKHVFHMLATVVPSAKQQVFAAHNPADFAIVSFSDQPISLANAFESPIAQNKKDGFLKASINALTDYWVRINNAYALDENAAVFSLDEVASNGPRPFNRLPDFESWIANNGRV